MCLCVLHFSIELFHDDWLVAVMVDGGGGDGFVANKRVRVPLIRSATFSSEKKNCYDNETHYVDPHCAEDAFLFSVLLLLSRPLPTTAVDVDDQSFFYYTTYLVSHERPYTKTK